MNCPACGGKLSATADKVGRMAQCPHCGDSVRIVAPPGMSAPPSDSEVRESILADLADEGADKTPETPPRPARSQPAYSPADYMPLAASSSALWKILFFIACPLALGLGTFAGYVLRPLTPEELVAKATEEREDILTAAREDAEDIRQEARKNADELLATARERAATIREEKPAPADPARTGNQRPTPPSGDKSEQAYRQQVKITRQSIGKSDLHRTALFGEIENTGNRALAEVKLTIACLDANGQHVLEKTLYPVNAAEDLIGATPPLRAGGVTSFEVGLDDAPGNWSGKVSVVVASVKFDR